tara:strand:- start:5129 stop:5845 length:717 start_codon:yes stop_codon:yes gene_type:complete
MSKKGVHVSKVEKIKLGKKSAKFFRASFENCVFFWSSLHKAQQKHGVTDKEHLIYEIKVLITEEAFEAMDEYEINKEPKEVPLTFKEGKSGDKLKKKFEMYVPYAEKAYKERGEKLYLTSLSRNAVTSGGKAAKVSVVGRNPNFPLTESIGNGSTGNFRIGCIEAEDGTPAEGKFNCYLEGIQILKLVEYVDKDYGEESLGDVGFGNYDEEEDEEASTDPTQEDDEDDGDDDFDEFDS